MPSLLFSWMQRGTVFFVVAWLLAPIPGYTNEDRPFIAIYELINPISQGTDITVTLRVRVFNNGSRIVNNGTAFVVFENASGVHQETITDLNLPADGNLLILREIAVPVTVFLKWQEENPDLRMEYQDAEGNTVRQKIELAYGQTGKD